MRFSVLASVGLPNQLQLHTVDTEGHMLITVPRLKLTNLLRRNITISDYVPSRWESSKLCLEVTEKFGYLS
jgi:hypothetical protein